MSAESPQLPHLPRIQSLRGLAAMAVVLGHMFVVEAKYGGGPTWLGEWALLGQVGVDLFFVISGFIMVYVTWTLPRGSQAPLPFLWRRVTRIYPLYWIVSAAVLVAWLWRPDLVFDSNPDPDILKSFLLIPDETLPLLSVGWTLIYEMYFYFIFAALLLLPLQWLLPALLTWAVVAVGLGLMFGQVSPPMTVATSPLVLEFVAGALLGMAYLKRGRTVGIAFAGAVLFIIAVWQLSTVGVSVFEDHFVRALWGGLAAAGLVALVVFQDTRPRFRLGEWLGDISYSLYLTHILTLSVVGRLWAEAASEGRADNAIALVVMLSASLAVAHVTYVAVERPLIRAFRRRRAPASPHAAD